MATVIAEGSRGRMRSARNCGRPIEGRPLGIPPKREPIVSTGSPKTATAPVAAISATIEPGSRRTTCGTTSTTINDAAPRAAATQLIPCRCAPSAAIRPKNSLGVATARPRKSLIWVEAMSSAMPLVNPSTTGRGMNFTDWPRPVSARNTRMTPAIMVTISRPERPCCAMMPATMTTKAPVGPPIWMREPPSADTRNPPTIAV